ncbi:MAG: hypothetical protein Q8O91_11255 [Candidatus Aminicenantes bacterium]|nr:hypothetical protein [Candidatus Aminicenantes bacterium]
MDPRAKPGALTRDVNTRLSAAEADPQTKPGAPAAAPAAVDSPWARFRQGFLTMAFLNIFMCLHNIL